MTANKTLVNQWHQTKQLRLMLREEIHGKLRSPELSLIIEFFLYILSTKQKYTIILRYNKIKRKQKRKLNEKLLKKKDVCVSYWGYQGL